MRTLLIVAAGVISFIVAFSYGVQATPYKSFHERQILVAADQANIYYLDIRRRNPGSYFTWSQNVDFVQADMQGKVIRRYPVSDRTIRLDSDLKQKTISEKVKIPFSVPDFMREQELDYIMHASGSPLQTHWEADQDGIFLVGNADASKRFQVSRLPAGFAREIEHMPAYAKVNETFSTPDYFLLSVQFGEGGTDENYGQLIVCLDKKRVNSIAAKLRK